MVKFYVEQVAPTVREKHMLCGPDDLTRTNRNDSHVIYESMALVCPFFRQYHNISNLDLKKEIHDVYISKFSRSGTPCAVINVLLDDRYKIFNC